VCVDPFAQPLRRHFLTELAKLGLSRIIALLDVMPARSSSEIVSAMLRANVSACACLIATPRRLASIVCLPMITPPA
jgi:hypothetical protein